MITEKKIIIWGVGKYGKRLYHLLKNLGYGIDYFCQTGSDKETYYDEVPIIEMQKLSEISEELIVLIAIKDNQISDEIKGRLLDLNLSGLYIYECGEFINKNIPNIVGDSKHQCNLCGSLIQRFERVETVHSELFEKYHIIGGGPRENAVCPVCGGIDRIRWQYWVISKHTSIFFDKCSVLHIAPECVISKRIQANSLCDYYSGDLERGCAMHIVDVTNIQFEDNFFDYIIMNHVLEHIENESKAISELKRVLKPNGKLILSFPICKDMNTYEDSDIQTSEERYINYGQEDHVRLYGYDYKERLEQYGLHIDIYSPQNECTKEVVSRYGFIVDDVVLICRND